jgi:predicted  nucleic acid-binding Zn-ribbon protein
VTIVESLIELQEVDGRIRELELELKDLPRRKALETARLSGVSTDLQAAKANQEYASRKVKSYEEEASALKDKIRDLKNTQSGLKSNKEYQQYAIQIDLVSHDLETTENNQLAAMDDLPSAQARIDDAQSKYDAEKSAVDQFCAEVDERIALVKAELEEAQKERAEKAAAVDDPKFMLYYERLRTKRWPVVVALTADGVCDGCHLVQPPSVGQLADANAKNGEAGRPQSIVACTMCGRMLYRA